ncbi:MAG: hypothetical protein A4E32_01563 [Methanomassiliicoccales archaeon PtaU1.Bin124]|nr:MAG: hypothetical protein A4E32_01563 [Methanomassiliicoccales archaeon PtaU1.Bin124]
MADLSPDSEKLFKAMKKAGAVSDDKAIKAEKATSESGLPKARCMNSLQDLEKKGYVKAKKNNNAVTYYLVKTTLE